MREFDVAVVGAGAAGLSLTHRLARANLPGAGRGGIALLEPPPGPLRAPARTWCFWEHDGGEWDGILAARWDRLAVIGPDGRRRRSRVAPLAYKMLRSGDFEAHVRSGLDGGVTPYDAAVTGIEDGPGRAAVRAVDPAGVPFALAARWVFDSRPPSRLPPAPTTLLQHFRGWFVRTEEDAFDPDDVVLMDLRTPQPPNGVSFGYLLPLSAREALVEYTEFTRQILDDAGYERALRDYTGRVLRLDEFTVTATEQGAIPMTSARFRTRAGRRVFRIGAAGGATRPSTGYTFSGIQRQAAAVVRALARGRVPVPPVPHRRRHLAMDAVLLRALDTGRLDGAEFFARLFGRNSLRDVLDFLDGHSTLPRELAMGATVPLVPMSATTAEHAWRTLRPG
ncbi:lycopene cyclase family protein [Allosalinactinospora lopnorensis]|uniref:lycopene cyclase family protein n=1 Tax=Allosalinactinospora lopnorensis TaxID=1352348 RepID=UPI000623EE8C|nr:lycopene cyclase family protein [Allosalinactinospora lopnorensis]